MLTDGGGRLRGQAGGGGQGQVVGELVAQRLQHPRLAAQAAAQALADAVVDQLEDQPAALAGGWPPQGPARDGREQRPDLVGVKNQELKSG